MNSRAYAYAVALAFLALTLYPLTFVKYEDSFPLSNYPMFAKGRKDARLVADYAVAVSADGDRQLLPPEILANREVLQAQAVLRGAIRRGKQALAQLCGEVAAKVADSSDYKDAVEIRLVRGVFDAVKYFDGTDTVGKERLHRRCKVTR